MMKSKNCLWRRTASRSGLMIASLLLVAGAVAQPVDGEDSLVSPGPADEAARLGHELVQIARRLPGAGGDDRLLGQLREVAAQRRDHLAHLVVTQPDRVRRLALPESRRRGLPAAVREHVEQRVAITGTLRKQIRHGAEGTTRDYAIIDGHNVAHPVFFAEPPMSDVGGRVQVRGLQLPGVGVVADAGNQGLAYLAPDSDEREQTSSGTIGEVVNPLGAQQTLVMLVNFQDTATSTPFSLAEAHAAVFGTVGDYLIEASYGRTWLTGEVYGWYTLPIASSCNTTQIQEAADAEASAAGLDLSTYGRLIYVIKGSASCVWSGASDMWVYPSRAWINGNLDPQVIAHELGHGFGLYHSSFLDCGATTLGSDCTVARDDKFDTMGASPEPAHFNAFQKERLGWFAPGEIATVSANGSYAIRAMELAGGTKAIRVPKESGGAGASWYYLEYRQPIGFDGFIAGNDNVTNGVLVHTGVDNDGSSSRLLDMTPDSSLSVYSDRNDPALTVGQTYHDPAAGITITTSSTNSTDSIVDISLGPGTCQRGDPVVSLSPSQGPWVSPGTPVDFTLTVANADNEACGPSDFDLTSTVPGGWSATLATESLSLAPGASATTVLTVSSSTGADDGFYDAEITAVNRVATAKRGSAFATYVVSTGSANSAPTAVDDDSATTVNKAVTVDVIANDIDADGDSLTILSVTGGANGTATVEANRVIYTPARRFNGVDQVQYVVSDGIDTATANVTIQVRKKGGSGRPRK